MKAFEIKAAIDQLLIDNAHGEFQVFSILSRRADAVDIEHRPFVYTAMNGGDFGSNKRNNGPRTASNTLEVYFAAGAKTELDLGVLDDPSSTPEQKSEAMLASQCAAPIARDKAEAVCTRLYRILMSRANQELAGENPKLTVNSYKIGDPTNKGAIVQVGGVINATFDTTEYAGGLEPVPARDPAFDVDLKLSADVKDMKLDEALQGVTINEGEN